MSDAFEIYRNLENSNASDGHNIIGLHPPYSSESTDKFQDEAEYVLFQLTKLVISDVFGESENVSTIVTAN